MSAIIIDDKIVHYEVLGRGKPIIFLHGWVGSWRYWIPTMQAASTTYRAYALDLWGFGETAKETKLYPLEQQTELLNRFMNEMGIGKVALIGHGLGAVVALLYATKQTFVVDRIMVIGLPVGQNNLSERFGTTSPTELASRLLNQTPNTDAARSEAPKADEAAIKNSIEDLKFINLLEISKQITTASLLVHGLKDPVIETPNLDSNRDLPNMVHHIVFDESGHFPMLDQPSKFQRLMNDFLDLDSGESPQRLQLKDEWKRRVR
jgi:pimeloyl-ACP methyl ester carboxylesterase